MWIFEASLKVKVKVRDWSCALVHWRSPSNSASKTAKLSEVFTFYVNPWDSLDRHDFQLSFELTEKRYVHTCKYVPILPKIRLHRLDVVNGLSSEKMNLLSTPFNRHLAGTWC